MSAAVSECRRRLPTPQSSRVVCGSARQLYVPCDRRRGIPPSKRHATSKTQRSQAFAPPFAVKRHNEPVAAPYATCMAREHGKTPPARATVAGRAPEADSLESRAEELQAKFVRGLGDPTRLRIVGYLLDGPRSVSDLIAFLGMPQSRVSNHLACLKWCGYVATERRGRSVIYRVTDARVRAILELTRAIVSDNAQRIADCVRIPDR